MKTKLTFGLLVLLFALFTSSCKKDFINAEWDTDIIVPLITTELSINNLLADSLIQVQSDSSLTLVYDNTLYSLSTDSLVSFPDSITHQYFNIPITITANPGQTVLNITDNKNLNLGGAQLTTARIKSGKIILKIRNTIAEKMLCTYQIPCAEINGNILEVTELIPAASLNSPYEFIKTIDISGYNVNLKGPANSSYNKLTTITKAWVDPNGNPVTITYHDSLLFDARFSDVTLEYAKGFFGSNSIISGTQISNFDLFKKISSDQLNLEQVKMKLSISNGFGVDARFVFNAIKSINTKTNTSVNLSSPIIGAVTNINRASETYLPANPVQPSLYEFNLSNSNIKQLIENLPDKIEYSIDIFTNPLGNVSSGNDFVYSSSGFKAGLNMEIPLSFIAQNLTLTDTLEFNLDAQNSYQINQGKLILSADNGFPLSAQIQMYMLNSSNAVSDSLFSGNNIILPAYTDAQNIVTQNRKTLLHILIDNDKLNKLYETEKVLVKVRFNSPAEYTKIFKSYTLKLKLTGDFNTTMNHD